MANPFLLVVKGSILSLISLKIRGSRHHNSSMTKISFGFPWEALLPKNANNTSYNQLDHRWKSKCLPEVLSLCLVFDSFWMAPLKGSGFFDIKIFPNLPHRFFRILRNFPDSGETHSISRPIALAFWIKEKPETPSIKASDAPALIDEITKHPASIASGIVGIPSRSPAGSLFDK